MTVRGFSDDTSSITVYGTDTEYTKLVRQGGGEDAVFLPDAVLSVTMNQAMMVSEHEGGSVQGIVDNVKSKPLSVKVRAQVSESSVPQGSTVETTTLLTGATVDVFIPEYGGFSGSDRVRYATAWLEGSIGEALALTSSRFDIISDLVMRDYSISYPDDYDRVIIDITLTKARVGKISDGNSFKPRTPAVSDRSDTATEDGVEAAEESTGEKLRVAAGRILTDFFGGTDPNSIDKAVIKFRGF